MISSVLVVCTGNICRSPFVEQVLIAALPSAQVSSAGTHALVGHPADEKARAIGSDIGYDLVGHTARQLVPELVRSNELILVMEQGQREWIHNMAPTGRGRVFMLGHWRDDQEVSDPYRRGEGVFRSVFEQALSLCDDWTKRIA